MAALFNGIKVAQMLSTKQPLVVYAAARNLAGWNKDYKPAKYPKTPKERELAAKKYNMLPEEYRPYADDGLGYGDYPKLVAGLGIEAKDNFYPYDYPEHKRNFNEAVHADIDMYGEDRYSQAEPPRYANSYYWLCFGGVMTGCIFLYFLLDDVKMFQPVAAKQYPINGEHYTFDAEK